MKESIVGRALVFTIVTLAPTVPASAGWLDNTTVTPVVGVTNSTLDYRRAAASDNRQTTLNSLSLNLGVAGDKWYGRVNAEMPLAPGYFLGGSGAQEMKRTDYSLSAGYTITPGISIFAGYLYTLIDMRSNTFLESQIDSGPYLGGSWEMYRGKASSVSVNVAYASLNGSAVRTSAPVSGSDFNVTGPTTGLSYGISWTGQLGREGRSYVLSYKIQDFKFEGTGTGGPQTIDKDYGVLTFAIIL